MITIYKYLGIFLIPIIKINIFFRIRKGKENKNRYKERYGVSNIKRPKGNLIWIHATSVGEFKSADILINSLSKKHTILVTTTTSSAANFAIKNYKGKIIHQFIPYDIFFWVENFLNKWRPNLIIWIESDLWPLTLSLIKQKSIKSILVNVRMSPKSFEKWKNLKSIYNQMISCFSEIFAQSELDKYRIEYLTNRKIKFIGNLKLATINNNKIPKTKINSKSFNKFKILMLASTHKNEEEIFIPLIKKITSSKNKYKVIIAPRHPERSASILSILNKNHIPSKIINNSNYDKKVLILNTFGDLNRYFLISDIVFLGGSLINKGGHNPIEAAINNCIIISGPNIFNWENIYNKMKKNRSCFIYKDIKSIEKKIMNLLKKSDSDIKKIKKRSKIFAKRKFFDSSKLFFSINKVLKNS